jgi:chromosome partitioning protein
LGFDDDIDLDQTVYPAIMGEPPEDDAVGADEEQELRLPTPVRVHGMDLIPAHLNIAIIEREILSVFLGVLRLRDAVRKLTATTSC